MSLSKFLFFLAPTRILTTNPTDTRVHTTFTMTGSSGDSEASEEHPNNVEEAKEATDNDDNEEEEAGSNPDSPADTTVTTVDFKYKCKNADVNAAGTYFSYRVKFAHADFTCLYFSADNLKPSVHHPYRVRLAYANPTRQHICPSVIVPIGEKMNMRISPDHNVCESSE